MMNYSPSSHNKYPATLKRKALARKKRRAVYQTLFASNPAVYGTADNIRKDGCLALAKLGHRVWNQWRKDHPVTKIKHENGEIENRNIADFSGVVFNKGEADFQRFRFGDGCQFYRATFHGTANFSYCMFHGSANFSHCIFGKESSFNGAEFKGDAIFVNCTFGANSSFNGARFGTESQFTRTLFKAHFEMSTFAPNCHFVGSQFYGQAIFNNAKFFNSTFSNTVFHNKAEFKDDTTLNACKFSVVTFSQVSFDRSNWTSTSFSDATFKGEVSFSGVTFDSTVVFENSTFEKKVDFHATDFHGSYFEFRSVTFQSKLEFNGCKWNGNVRFHEVFGGSVAFLGNVWYGVFDACSSSWQDKMMFQDDRFNSTFSLKGVQALRVETIACTFENTADFAGFTKELISNFYGHDYKKRTDEFSTKNGLSPNKFYEVDFKGCVFKSEVDFRDREFVSTAIWTKSDGNDLSYKKMVKQANGKVVAEKWQLGSRGTDFAVPPIFHGAKLPQDCSFVHAQFPKTASGKEEYERRYRTLRLALAQHGATREEQRFFKSEMAEELARIKSKQKGRYWLMRLYSCFDYGFKAFWPLVWLCLLILLMMLSLGYKNGFALDLSGDGVSRLSCAISTLVPLLGSPKSCEGLQSIPVLTEIFKVIGYTLTFLVGLALRNHLKMK